jgi:pimeloyl-ACP methyl ester carboxylesterase
MSEVVISPATSHEPGAMFEEKVIAAAGFDVRYWEAGEGDAVLYLHGAGGFVPTLALDEVAAAGFRVIAPEMPGWGAQPNTVTDFDGLAAQVVEIASALGLESFHLVGTSLGGACALHLVALRPELVTSMVLEAPGKFREACTPPDQLSAEQFARAFRTHPERIPHLQPPDPEFMARVWPLVVQLMGTGEYDEVLGAKLAALGTRTLVLFGVDDGIINPINGRTIRRLMSNSTLQYVYDAAHDIQCDRPEAFADIVTDFLRRGMGFMINEEDGIINP